MVRRFRGHDSPPSSTIFAASLGPREVSLLSTVTHGVAGSNRGPYGRGMHSRKVIFAGVIGPAVLAGLVVLGCVTTAADGADGGSSSCGQVQLSGDNWGGECQSWINQYCCSQLQACNSDFGCAQLLACENSCPTPRTDTCTATCTGNAASLSIDALDAIGTCTKTKPSGGTSIPSTCAWP